MIKEKDVHITVANALIFVFVCFRCFLVLLSTEHRIMFLGAENQRGTTLSVGAYQFLSSPVVKGAESEEILALWEL